MDKTLNRRRETDFIGLCKIFIVCCVGLNKAEIELSMLRSQTAHTQQSDALTVDNYSQPPPMNGLILSYSFQIITGLNVNLSM